MSVLTAISMALQSHFIIRRDSVGRFPLSLYFLVVASSGERKTTVDGCVMKQLEDHDSEAAMKYATDLKKWRDGPSDQTQDSRNSRNSQSVFPPRDGRILIKDSTIEGLTKRMDESAGSLGWVLSEAGIVFGGYSVKKSSGYLMSVLNSFWSGESISVDRGGANPKRLSGRLTLFFQVQPAVLAEFLAMEGRMAGPNGFLSRLLVAAPARSGVRPYQEQDSPLVCLENFHQKIGDLLNAPVKTNEQGHYAPQELTLKGKAKERWIEAYNLAEERRAYSTDEAIQDCINKEPEQILRVAAVLDGYRYGLKLKTISEAAVQAAQKIVGYHTQEVIRLVKCNVFSDNDRDAKELEAWILKQTGGVGIIARSLVLKNGPNRMRTKARLDTAIMELQKRNRVIEVAYKSKKYLIIHQDLCRPIHSTENKKASISKS